MSGNATYRALGSGQAAKSILEATESICAVSTRIAGRNLMRFKMIVTLIFATSVSIFASTSAAQRTAQNPPAQPPPAQSAEGQQQSAAGMMPPDMMQMRPLQRVIRLLAALDDPRVRTELGLTDQQADSLRKIFVDTETFTIKTGADIAVNSIELRELLRADKPDRAAVMSKGDAISKATSQLINHFLEAMLAAKAILTPEQQKMIRAYMERRADALPPPRARP
jgi:Spy/CpxP family protein refolding chaperone